MLSVKLDSTIDSSILLLEQEPEECARTFRRFLLRLKGHVEGAAGDATFTYRRTSASRIVRIKIARDAWTSDWTADIHVICADLWQETEEVRFECGFVYGPKLDVPQQEMQAQSAGSRIQTRLDEAIDALIGTPEFIDVVSR